MFKIGAFVITALFTQFYVRVGILLTRSKHLHDSIISGIWSMNLAPPLSISNEAHTRKNHASTLYKKNV